MALYFYFNETTGDMVYSDKEAYEADGYEPLGEQTEMNPDIVSNWVFHYKRSGIKSVTKDPATTGKIAGLTSMNAMFFNCPGLTSLDLSGFDTSKVTNMINLFSGCSSLTPLDLSGFDTSQVTAMGGMFAGCRSLANLDLSGFDTSQVTNMLNMFVNCSSLTSLDLSGFDTSQVTNMSSMFNGCSSLRLLSIGGSMSNVLSKLPADQYYPASGGSPVAKASLTAGTWVRDEADLSKITTLVEQAQAFAALRRDAGRLEKRIAALEKAAG